MREREEEVKSVVDERGVSRAWQTMGDPKGDARWRLPPTSPLLERESGFKHDLRVTHTHAHTLSFCHSAEHLSARLLTWRPFGSLSLFNADTHTHTDTHTKTLPINACRKFITDTDTAHYASTLRTAKICQTTNRMIFSFLTQTLQFNMQVHLLNKVF